MPLKDKSKSFKFDTNKPSNFTYESYKSNIPQTNHYFNLNPTPKFHVEEDDSSLIDSRLESRMFTCEDNFDDVDEKVT